MFTSNWICSRRHENDAAWITCHLCHEKRPTLASLSFAAPAYLYNSYGEASAVVEVNFRGSVGVGIADGVIFWPREELIAVAAERAVSAAMRQYLAENSNALRGV